MREARRAALAVPGVRTATAFGDRLHLAVDAPGPDVSAIDAALRAAGAPAEGIDEISASMEDVFIDQIARARAA